jgi:hypothetical protein
MSRLIISEIERKHISSLHNLFLLEQTVEKVKVFKDKGGTYQYAKLPNGTYWYKAGSGAWTQQTKKSGMEAIEKRITSDLVDKQPDLEITSIDTDYEVEVKNDGDGETIETTATTTANITKTTGDTSTETTGTTGTTSSDTSTEGGEDEGGEDGGEDKSISAVRGVDDDPQPQLNTSMAEKYPKNPLAKYSGYFKTIKII